MAEPTNRQKLDAARAALKAAGINASDGMMRTVTTIFWSQAALLPEPKVPETPKEPAPPPVLSPMFCELLGSNDPALQAQIIQLNQQAAALAEQIRHANSGQPAAARMET